MPPPPGGGAPPPQPPGPPGGFVSGQQTPNYQQSQSGGSGVGEAFQYGWTKFQQNLGQLAIAILVWIGALILAGIIYVGLNILVGAIAGEDEFGNTNSLGIIGFGVTSALGMLVMVAANFIGGAALLRVGLLSTRGEEITPAKLFSTENMMPYVLTSLLVAVINMVASFVSCGILGLVASFFLFFAPFYALDRGTSPMEALRASVTLVNRNLATVVVLFIGALIAYVIGLAICLVGVLVAFPVILIAYGYMYRTLNGEPVAP